MLRIVSDDFMTDSYLAHSATPYSIFTDEWTAHSSAGSGYERWSEAVLTERPNDVDMTELMMKHDSIIS